MQLRGRQVAEWRAHRHHLAERVPASAMLEAVSRIGGLHAQVMSSAALSLWARVDGLEPDAVSTALWEGRSLVKTWAMRGTLHLLPSAEYRFWQGALSRYRHYLAPGWLRGFGITAEQLDALLAAVPRALDGPPLTRTELADAVAELTGSAELGAKVKGSWGSLLKPAAYRGDLCFAPSVGQAVRFTRPDRWLTPAALVGAVDPETAAVEVTRRYLAAYGPATRDDYAHWWGGLSAARAGALIAALGDDVVAVDVEGREAWLLAAQLDEVRDAPSAARSVRLLPAFDPYVIEASTRPELLPGASYRPRVYRPQGWLTPVLVVGGRMHGVWRHERTGRRLAVAVETFASLPKWAGRAVEQEAERLAGFLGGSLELVVREAMPG